MASPRHRFVYVALLSTAAVAAPILAPAHGQIAQLRPSLPSDGAPRVAEPARPQQGRSAAPAASESDGADDGDEAPAKPTAWQTEPPDYDEDGVPRLEPVTEEAGSVPTPQDVKPPATDLTQIRHTVTELEDTAPETDPAVDRRPARFARFEPYDALGLRLGTFVFLPELQIGSAWTTNEPNAPHPQGDALLVARPRLRLLSDWRAHALDITATALSTYHQRYDSDDDRAWSVDARGRIDVTRRTNVELSYGHDIAQESRTSLDATLLGVPRADVVTDRAAAALNTRFNRLALQLRGAAEWTSYDTSGTGPTTVSASLRDRTMTEETARVSWELKPTLVAFAEAAGNRRDYAGIDASDGLTRSSSGERYRAGLGFGTAGPTLRGEVSLGWGRQAGDDSRLATVSGLLIDANLAWRIDGLNSLLVTAATDFSDTVLPGVLAATTRRVRLEGRHAFTRALIASASVGVNDSSYDDSTLAEREITGGTVLEYYMSRELMTYLSWQHTHLLSTDASRRFSADEFGVGVRLAR